MRIIRFAVKLILLVMFLGICAPCRTAETQQVIPVQEEVEETMPIATDPQQVIKQPKAKKSILRVLSEQAIQNAAEATKEDLAAATENIQEVVEEVVEEQLIIDNLSEWALANESTDPISLWKKSDEEGNLLIGFKNAEDELIAIFKYEDVQTVNYDEWVLCLEEVTTSDFCDYAFTAYHEVGGKNAKNVQAQICVLINRQKSTYFPDTIRAVVTAEKQYSCSWVVVNRRLKSNSFLEQEDLEKCFRQTALVLAGELIQEVPANVVFAAKGKQGSGVWQTIDGTVYCFLN